MNATESDIETLRIHTEASSSEHTFFLAVGIVPANFCSACWWASFQRAVLQLDFSPFLSVFFFFSGGFVCCFAFLYYSFCACLAPVQSALLSMGMRPRVRVIHFRASHGFFCRVWPHLILFKLSKDVRSGKEKKKRHIVKGTKSKDIL